MYNKMQGTNSKFPRPFRRQNRFVKARVIRRLLKKSGRSNVLHRKITTRWYYYLLDLGNNLVEGRWHWTIFALTSSFMLSWIIFATAWMLIATANGDLDLVNPSATPCLTGIKGFAGYLMFSLETQQTIGYGSRYINHYCPEGTFMMCLQLIMGSAICGGMVSIVYAKMVSPRQINYKSLFSKKAVIGLRDSTLCLIFRVRDENSRYSVDTSISAYLVQVRVEEPFLKSIALEPYGIIIWPLEVVHKITPSSPFYNLSAKELVTRRFEIIVTMKGTSAVTGQSSKTRTSYMSTEILWGYRFKPCVSFDHEKDCYFVNHREFNSTEELMTPLCSAQRLDEVIDDIVSPVNSPIYSNSPIFNYNLDQFCNYNQYTTGSDYPLGLDYLDDANHDEDNHSLYDGLETGDVDTDTVLPIEIYEYVNDLRQGDKAIKTTEGAKKRKVNARDTNTSDAQIETLIASLESVLYNSQSNSTNNSPRPSHL